MATALLILSQAFTLKADDSGAASTEPSTDIRREMASEYKYLPPGKRAEPLPSSLNSSSTGIPATPRSAEKDVVAMAPFEVRESGTPAMPASMTESNAPKGSPITVAQKLGIGAHYAKLGKVRLFVSTVFYIPIIAGFDW
jgi:hypothetical protein